jgi:hypothetical protein
MCIAFCFEQCLINEVLVQLIIEKGKNKVLQNTLSKTLQRECELPLTCMANVEDSRRFIDH